MPSTYREFVSVAPRFTRAINVERDARMADAVNGYVLTSTAEGVLGRVAAALRAPAGHRAWTLTGPYGSGKSAFAVFIGNLLGSSREEGGRIARRILLSRNEGLFREFFDRRKRGTLATDGFCPIILTGAP